MTYKKFKTIKLIMVIIMAIIFSQSIVFKNFFIPATTLIIGALILLYLRKRVTGVMADERDWQTAGRSAILALQIYSWVAVLIMFLFYSLQDLNPYYEAVAITLAFSTCLLMLLYGLIFRYYNKVKMTGKKKTFIIIALVIFLIFILFALRILSGEDNWICQNGQWIKHGQPNYPAPQIECK